MESTHLFDVVVGGSETDGQFRPITKHVYQDGDDKYRLVTDSTRHTGLYAHGQKSIPMTRSEMHEHLTNEARDYFATRRRLMGVTDE